MNFKDRLLRKFSGLFLSDLPREIQIQTASRCNAKCTFCPCIKLPAHLPHGKMSEELFKKIIDEIVAYKPKKIKPYLMNEPLVDKRIPDFIGYINKRKYPSTLVEIYTNGGLLNERVSEQIIDSGLDRLIVSFQGIDPVEYEKVMVGLRYDAVLRNLENFLNIRERRNSKLPYFEIRTVNTGFSKRNIESQRSFWKRRGVNLVIKPLENELNQSVESAQNAREWRPLAFCRRLFAYGWILYNGDMVLCCCDWEREQVLGNVKDKTISEIWNGAEYDRVRRKFISGDIQDIICSKCKIDSKIIPIR